MEKQEQPSKEEAQGQSILSAETAVTPEDLTVAFITESDPTIWTHVFLETDGNEETGHRHWSDVSGRRGMDYLVEGETLYKWSGQDDQRGWHWQRITNSTVKRVTNGQEVRVEIPWKDLGVHEGSQVSLFIATATEDFKETLDILPREEGALHVTVPAQPPRADVAPPSSNARARFKKINSYACYYGKGNVEALSKRGAVIIETANQTPGSVAAIRKSRTLAIGYISAGEDVNLRTGDGKGPGGFDSSYYDRNNDGRPDRNETWNSYYTNAGSEAWIKHFLGEAKRLREEYGVDGFFLDTVESFTLYTENRQPMVALIQKLREEHPEAVIVLNRGWDLLPDLAGAVDGVMYESFTLSYDFGTKSYVRMRPSALDEGLEIVERFLRPAQEKHGLVVLALDYAAGSEDSSIQDAVDRAVTLNMIPEISNIYLDQIYDHSFVGKKKDVWLQRRLTPESMSFTTTRASNGFPEGTRVMPSSLYPDYEVAPVLEEENSQTPSSRSWRNRAWASRERPDPHWIEFSLPQAQPLSGMKVVWATDQGEVFPSRRFAVQVKSENKSEWETVWKTETNLAKTTEAVFPSRDIQKIRLLQEPEGGSSARPNLMWVERVEALP